VRSISRLVTLAVSFSLCCAAGAPAATLQLVGNFDQPMFVTSDPADPDRLFVVQREGTVVQVQDGGVSEFADLSPLVSCCDSERGLLSIALAPDFDSSGRFYAAYTGTAAAGGEEGDVHVDAFRPGETGEEELVREPIITVGHTENANHNGGQLQFGPDGYLYISIGDGGGGGDPLESGQNSEVLLGKILRIDPRPGEEPPYVIPPGNPFAAGLGRDEVWSYGLRNPWRFSFDRVNGDMVIGDVGQGKREEVDLAPSTGAGDVGGAASNYGWNCREGLFAYPSAPVSCGASGFTDPVFDYPHDDPGNGGAFGCAITGGYVVRDPSLGDLYGRYLYADFCQGELRSLVLPKTAGGQATDDRSEGRVVDNPNSFGEDSSGRIYVVSIGGDIYRLAPEPAQQPPVLTPAAPGTPAPQSTVTTATRLFLRVARRPQEDEIVVRAIPCPGTAGERVVLKRGGRRVAAMPLDSGCTARFPVRGAHRSTFRALLPASGYRSQVLTIALAKPRP
jgi:Glucose / Sorbosone dehydrogenase